MLPKDGRKSRRTKRMQRDATAVSIVRGGRRVDSFTERQQLAGGAPLMRMPIYVPFGGLYTNV
jgi:hypothetical protein